MRRLADAAFLRCFGGSCSHVPLSLFRIGLAVLVLARTTDLLRPWFALDHHALFQGLEFWPESERTLAPRLHSPLLPLPAWSDATVRGMVIARTLLAALLLCGVRTRGSALLLFLVGYGLMASDRYRYFHHMHLLWLSCLWVACLPGSNRWSLERVLGAHRDPAFGPRWPLQVLRAQALVVYAAAGLAKLDPAWLSGASLQQLARAGLIGGPAWARTVELVGVRGASLAVLGLELSLVALLSVRRTRVPGVVLGVALHAFISASMIVSTFSAQMGLYLMLFLPWDRRAESVDAV